MMLWYTDWMPIHSLSISQPGNETQQPILPENKISDNNFIKPPFKIKLVIWTLIFHRLSSTLVIEIHFVFLYCSNNTVHDLGLVFLSSKILVWHQAIINISKRLISDVYQNKPKCVSEWLTDLWLRSLDARGCSLTMPATVSSLKL